MKESGGITVSDHPNFGGEKARFSYPKQLSSFKLSQTLVWIQEVIASASKFQVPQEKIMPFAWRMQIHIQFISLPSPQTHHITLWIFFIFICRST